MRFRIMRFSIYAEVRSSKNDSPFMPFSQIIPHLCGFIITEIYLSSTYLHINEGIKGSQALMDNKIY